MYKYPQNFKKPYQFFAQDNIEFPAGNVVITKYPFEDENNLTS